MLRFTQHDIGGIAWIATQSQNRGSTTGGGLNVLNDWNVSNRSEATAETTATNGTGAQRHYGNRRMFCVKWRNRNIAKSLMSAPKPLCLSGKTLEEISRHARETYPDECCGVIFSNGLVEHAQQLSNIQNKLHALDPITYPRTAVIAYAMDPKELERAIGQAESSGAKLKAFYHSHPNHDAYFSDEDKAFASPFGEPNFPGAAQIVVSICDGAIRRICAYGWSDSAADFIEIPVKKI
jgi:[CysO sulfur-carrier protein]-S-L-cysteine hydrolase